MNSFFKKLVLLAIVPMFMMACSASDETAKKAAQELCACAEGYDSKNIAKSAEGLRCVTKIVGNIDYNAVGEEQLAKAIKETCPEALKTSLLKGFAVD
ncbi:MAG: hypothetical protein MK212_04010 [Saprospiraceae bacterium]|nr:hypothetical protein [Saprospiraceae bacterium]